jgi:hypothetical protein
MSVCLGHGARHIVSSLPCKRIALAEDQRVETWNSHAKFWWVLVWNVSRKYAQIVGPIPYDGTLSRSFLLARD